MKKFKIVARKDFESQKIKENYEEVLVGYNWIKSDNPELVIVIGGDGTMLEAFRENYKREVKFVVLHTGTLGFYSDWNKEESDKLLDCILNKKGQEVFYPLGEFEFELTNGKKEKILALNEMVLKSKSLSTFVMEVYVNEAHFQTYRGDGMIVSTPSGSTAYNHSVGGSILHPSIDALQVSELAAINNREFRTLNRSLILPNHHKVEFFTKNTDRDILIGIDGEEYNKKGIRKIMAKVSEKKITFIRYRHFPFWDRVREKFLEE